MVPRDERASATRDPRRHRGQTSSPLPAPLTPFIGREREAAAIGDLLRQSQVRLLSLVGPGGVGKTRLALHVAAHLQDDFPDGVWFLPLAEVREPELVASAISQTLGIHELPQRTLIAGIANFIQQRHTLLVLDNFEHVAAAAPVITALLAACSRLTCLVTSRAVLHVIGEHVFPVPPLPLPPAAATTNAARANHSPAVRLFVQRAQAALPGFALTDDNAAAVERICRHLDGLPLAIELAAARVRHLSPAELQQQLTAGSGVSLHVLAGGPRDAPDRQRALRQAIAWSHELLSADERTLFRRLALFIDGFSVDAAEFVGKVRVGESASRPVGQSASQPAGQRTPITRHPTPDTFDLLASLVDQSLLRREDGAAGISRYHMLETIREFGLDQLAAAGEEEAIAEAHAAHFLALVEHAAPLLHGQEQRLWVDRLIDEYANVRAALAWFDRTGQVSALARMARSLFWFWEFRGHYHEVHGWYERILAVGTDLSPALRYAALTGVAHFARVLGDTDRAVATAREALALEETGDPEILYGLAEMTLSKIAFWQGDLARATALGDIAITKMAGSSSWDAAVMLRIAYNDIGMHLAHFGESARGIALLEEALRLVADTGDLYLAGVHWSDFGLAVQGAGDEVKAVQCYVEGLRVLWEANGEWYLAVPLSGIATCAVQRDPAAAARLYGAAEAMREQSGQPNWGLEQERDRRAIAAMRALLGDEAVARERAAGRTLPHGDAFDLAMHLGAAGAAGAAVLSPFDHLSTREREVLRLLVADCSDREIADRLFISPRTASKHVGAILSKLNVATRHQAARLATSEDLL